MSGRRRRALEREVRESIRKNHTDAQLDNLGPHLPAFTRMLTRRAKKRNR